MTSISAADFIRNNDLEGAIERYNKTTARWRDHWWKTVVEIFDSCEKWAKKYIIDRAAQTITAIKQAINRRRTVVKDENTLLYGDIEIAYLNGTIEKDTKEGEKAYFFKFYEDANRPPVFDKIGTTTKRCLDRLKQEIRYYNKAGFEIERVEICEIWDCGNTPAESYESFMRALLIKKFPNTWHKNDRFFGTDIPTSLFTSLCRQYAAL